MITVYVNEAPRLLAADSSLADLIFCENQSAQPFAFAVNGQIIPRAQHAATRLISGDRVDMLVPMQGG